MESTRISHTGGNITKYPFPVEEALSLVLSR